MKVVLKLRADGAGMAIFADYTILEINSAPGLDNYVYEGQQQDDYVKQLYSMVFDYLEKM